MSFWLAANQPLPSGFNKQKKRYNFPPIRVLVLHKKISPSGV